MVSKNRKGLAVYIGILIGAAFAALLVVLLAGRGSVALLNYANRYYMKFYQEKVPGFVSPWYEDGLHVVDEEFIDEIPKLRSSDKRVIIMGSSMSVVPLRDDELKLEGGYIPTKFVCGNGGWKSNRVMENLIEANGGFHENDIVKYEISFSTFREVFVTITESILDKWGKYSVDPDQEVTENSPLMAPVYALNLQLLRFQNVWELFQFAIEQYREPRPIGLGNFKNNYFNYETVADSCDMTAEMQESVENQILKLKDKTNVVVEFSCFPKGLQKTAYGRELNQYIDETLIPLLDENGITYLDYRNDYEDSDYADGVHLSYESAIHYTQKLKEDLNNIIKEDLPQKK